MYKSDSSVLVVDDDREVSDLLLIVLERAGHYVVVVGSGEEAVELCQGRGNAFDFALVDLSLPGLSGGKTIIALRRIWPALKVVACSGDVDEGEALVKLGLPQLRFLKKPFTADSLFETFRELAGANPSGSSLLK